MQLNPAEISELIKSRIEGLQATADVKNQGTVVSVTDGLCRIHRLSDAFSARRARDLHPLNETSFQVDRFCVSPLTHRQADGSFCASVSIRSGRGTASHDRVFRFTPQFSTRESARRYAAREGMSWVLSRR